MTGDMSRGYARNIANSLPIKIENVNFGAGKLRICQRVAAILSRQEILRHF
jgi:hypothetical protein